MLCFIQTRHRNIAEFYVLDMFNKYLSNEQAIKDWKYCVWLNNIEEPHLNFGIKENRLFCVRKLLISMWN